MRGQNPEASCESWAGHGAHRTRWGWPQAPDSGSALTQLPAAHVIELGAEEQGGDDVDDGEDNPECCVPFAEDLLGATRVGVGVQGC